MVEEETDRLRRKLDRHGDAALMGAPDGPSTIRIQPDADSTLGQDEQGEVVQCVGRLRWKSSLGAVGVRTIANTLGFVPQEKKHC